MNKSNTNTHLHKSKSKKNDEFYTLYETIENELIYYKDKFVDKVVYCNCDDYTKSNFTRYFKDNFNELKLKKLVCTGINSKYYEYNGENEIIKDLTSNGDFCSDECTSILEQSDVVVTNPPFSLFRKYISHLFEHNKKFLIVSNMNAVGYKEIFPYIQNNKLWWGCSLHAIKCHFIVPNDYEGNNTFVENGIRYGKVNNAIWLTNIIHQNRNKSIKLNKKYNKNEYPKYDNYDAIEVSKVREIPMDYDGIMGVPITFLDKYCPEQFEIVGFRKGNDDKDLSINGKCPYTRILIRVKKQN